MDEPVVIGPKFDRVIWFLVKAWGLGLLVIALLFSTIFTLGIDMTLPTATALKVVITFVMGSLFSLFAATLFTLPLLIISGVLAYLLHDKIWHHPWITTILTPIIGFALIQMTTGLFSRPGDTGVWSSLMNGILTSEGLAVLIALAVSAAYFSFKLRAEMQLLGRG